MRRIKLALDPMCLLNCDKVVSMEKRKLASQFLATYAIDASHSTCIILNANSGMHKNLRV
jgi:hypothetical protein